MRLKLFPLNLVGVRYIASMRLERATNDVTTHQAKTPSFARIDLSDFPRMRGAGTLGFDKKEIIEHTSPAGRHSRWRITTEVATTPEPEQKEAARKKKNRKNREAKKRAAKRKQESKARIANSFDFLGLPRELRNNIYREIAATDCKCGARAPVARSSCTACMEKEYSQRSTYGQLFIFQGRPHLELASKLRHSTMPLVNWQLHDEYLDTVVSHHMLILRFGLQTFRLTNWSVKRDADSKFGFEQAKAARHSDIPVRFVTHIKEFIVAICDNKLWDDTSMEKMSDALAMLPNLRTVLMSWYRETARRPIGITCTRKLELVDGRFTTDRPIDVTSLKALGRLTDHEQYC